VELYLTGFYGIYRYNISLLYYGVDESFSVFPLLISSVFRPSDEEIVYFSLNVSV